MTTEFPKLMWAPDGREFTVQDSDEQDRRLAEGFRLSAGVVESDVVAAGGDEDRAESDELPAPKKTRKK